MTGPDLDERSRSAAAAARAWAEHHMGDDVEAVLRSIRSSAAFAPVERASTRRAPLLLAVAAVIVLGVAGAVAVLGPDDSGDVLVPAETTDDPPTESTVVSVQTTPSPVTTVATEAPLVVDPDAPRSIVVEIDELDVQDAFPIVDAVVDVGAGAEQLGRRDGSGPVAPTIISGSSLVVADPANGRVQIVDPFALAASREEFTGGVGEPPVYTPIVSLPIAADAGLEPAGVRIGQPVAGPDGDEIFVPVVPDLPTAEFSVAIHRFIRTDDLTWQFADESFPETFDVDDEFVFAGRSLVHVASGDPVEGITTRDTTFVPIVQRRADGWSVTDEQGTETIWSVPFDGDATGLADGSVVIAGSRTDAGDAVDAAALLLRLWPDGHAAVSRFSAGTVGGRQPVTGDGAANLSTNDDGDWILQQWPLPDRAMDSPTQPDQDIGSCDGLSRSVRSMSRQANGYVFPWTVSGGPAGDNGAYVAVYDALGRTVFGGGCSSASDPPDRLEIRGASYRTYGDSIIVAIAEPLSLGGVSDAPGWLGEPIAQGVIESLASEVKVYRVPADRELPTADEDNTFLLVQVRGARRVRIESGGIGIYVPPEDATVAPADPFDLRSTATEFAQGYLDALAEERWDDAVTYIENDGRSWEDRPAFADLYALVGADVGTATALERWCTEERDCTRGVANGVLEQVSETQVSMAITFEVPGGPMFEQTINPLWTVGWFEGGLYVDGLPQVAR